MSKSLDFLKNYKPELVPENISVYDMWLDMVNNRNNFSYWYERIKGLDGKGFRVPKSSYIMLGYEELKKYSKMFYGEDSGMIYDFRLRVIEPLVGKFEFECDISNGIFIKNAVFSGKFDFSNCYIEDANRYIDLTKKILNINYEGLVVGANGYNEIVLREFIKPVFDFGRIYNGMPLRPEFRVFYDFDLGKLLYTVNYWDYDYCKDYLSKEDKRVFFKAKDRLEKYFKENEDRVNTLVSEVFKKNKVYLSGIWSIDILMNDENDFYLIDMAIASQSAYWDANRANRG